MANVKIQPGEQFETLTRQEMEHLLDRQTRNTFQEQARGISMGRFKDAAQVSGAAVALPATGQGPYGPRSGFLWDVKRITVTGLSGSDTVSVFRTTTNAVDLVDVLTVTKPTVYPKGVKLRGTDSEALLFSGAGLAATGLISVNGEADEVAEMDLYKLVGGRG